MGEVKGMTKIDLSEVSISLYSEMSKWVDQYLDSSTYKWHHQPSKGKYWINFLTTESASKFIFQWAI